MLKRWFVVLLAVLLAVPVLSPSAALAVTTSVPGAQPTEEMSKDRNFSIRDTDILNNYATGTAPGAQDSSLARTLNGVSQLTVRLFYVIPDSSNAVRSQVLYVGVKWGFGTANDSTGAAPSILRNTFTGGDSVVKLTTATAQSGLPNWIMHPKPGELPLELPGYLAGAQRVIDAVFDVPRGAQTYSVFVRPGYLKINTASAGLMYRGVGTIGSETKWKALYRCDVYGGR